MGSEFEGQLLEVLRAIDKGDFTLAMDESAPGDAAEIASRINGILMRLNALSSEIRRVSREIGTFGVFGGQAEVYGLQGSWKDLADDFNGMASSLTDQIRDLAKVTGEAVDGKPVRLATAPARGETRELKERLNTMLSRPELQAV